MNQLLLKAQNLLKEDLVRFCIVGGLGFLVHESLLFASVRFVGVPLLAALALSAEGAFLFSFPFHNNWTYKEVTKTSKKSWSKRLLEFHSSSWAGLVLMVSLAFTFNKVGKLHYLVAQALASATILFWNYYWTKFHIWKSKPASTSSDDTAEARARV